MQQESWCEGGRAHTGAAGVAGAAGAAASRADAVRGYGRQAAAEVARGEAAVPEALAPLVLVGAATPPAGGWAWVHASRHSATFATPPLP